MSQTNNITVKVYPINNLPDVGLDHEPIVFENIHYVSFVSSPGGQGQGTYGIPALLAEDEIKEEGLPMRILYVNPANIAAMEAERHS